ncbi:MAG: hypothetical protein GF344_00500, partial [Chitinivibrionales bacterium]|nr:hypothetical protein [Chitinivibrionales bacterium]MBD3355607.1 hypothetical protein [Chitinivibrionales bacterium]
MDKTIHSRVCAGLELVREASGADAAENLVAYAQRHLDNVATRRIRDLAASFKRSLVENHPMELPYSTILPILPHEHRENVEALMRDLEVQFLDNRYSFLRMVNAEGIPRKAVEDMLEKYCLSQKWVADPELPNIVARVVVRRLSQWELMCLLHDRIRKIVDAFAAASEAAGHPPRVKLASLGRLIAFLRWVPYEWTEEVLLRFIDDIRLSVKLDRLRLYISVMRAMFCRPRVQRKTVEHLCRRLLSDFDGRIPPTLMQLFRAVMIAGGQDTWNWLEERTRSRPELYADEFFLETMAMIDKVGTARILIERRDDFTVDIGFEPYLRLIAQTGQRSDETSDFIVGLWNDASAELKETILRTIDELHCDRACSYLIEQLKEEDHTLLGIKMLDSIAAAADLDQLTALPTRIGPQRPILYYHVIDLLYRRLIAHPVTFTHLKDYSLLVRFEEARARIYRLYQVLLGFQELLDCLLRLTDIAARHGFTENMRVTPEFIPVIDPDPHWKGQNKMGAITREIRMLLDECRCRAERHRASRPFLAELGTVLDFAPDLIPSHAEDIFGKPRRRFLRDRILRGKDLPSFATPSSTEQQRERLSQLRDKAVQSLLMIRERFLFTEWFVRKMPFTLTENLPRLLDQIRRGDDLTFNTGFQPSKTQNEHLRRTFLILSECTKQG